MAVKAQKKTTELKLVPRIESGMKEMERGMENLVEQLTELTTQSFYFGLGTAVLLKEGFEDFVEKAIKKGEASEKDFREKIRSLFKLERKAKKVETTMETRIEAGVRKVMDTLDIPSKSDVKKLSKRVAELSSRVSKLTQMKKASKPIEA